MDNFDAIENVEKVFGKLLSFAEACDNRSTEMGKGLSTLCEYGDIIAAARGQLRVLRRVKQNIALDELARMAQEDGLYTSNNQR